MEDIQLSKNFWLKEFTTSPTADRLGLKNTPTSSEIANLKRLCALVLQPARDALGPLRINSGFRSEKVNKAVGGSSTSAHRYGFAADVFPLNVSTRAFAEWIVLNCPKFDQVILEFGTVENPNWIHVSVDPRDRKRVIRARKKGSKTVYEPIQILPAISRTNSLFSAAVGSDFRSTVAEQILKWEGRFVGGKLQVYQLPTGDGGGAYEVAGINVRYHPEKALELKTLIEKGKHSEAEKRAVLYIAEQTDGVTKWTSIPSVECFLRDCAFNRGLTGAAKIYQMALKVPVDGLIGSETLLAAAACTPVAAGTLITDLRNAREAYERKFAGRSETSKFWKGLVNRWNNCEAFSRRF